MAHVSGGGDSAPPTGRAGGLGEHSDTSVATIVDAARNGVGEYTSNGALELAAAGFNAAFGELQRTNIGAELGVWGVSTEAVKTNEGYLPEAAAPPRSLHSPSFRAAANAHMKLAA